MCRSLDLQKQLYQLSLNTFKKSKKDHQITLLEFLNTQHPPDSAEELGLRQVPSAKLVINYHSSVGYAHRIVRFHCTEGSTWGN